VERSYTIAGFAALAIFGGFYVGFTGPAESPTVEERSASGFSLDSGPARSEAASAEPLRDAVAAVPAAPPAAAFRPAPAPKASEPAIGSESWVKAQAMFIALMAKPVDFIVKKTLLATGAGFAKFAKDPVRVNRYLRHPLIRGVINSPTLLRALLTQQAVVDGFLRSPAMQDPRAIAALAKSPLLKRISEDPGIQKVLAQPGVVTGVVSNPNTLGWLMSHPEGMAAFMRLSPAAGAALAPVRSLRR
jgi:hypothetical protein